MVAPSESTQSSVHGIGKESGLVTTFTCSNPCKFETNLDTLEQQALQQKNHILGTISLPAHPPVFTVSQTTVTTHVINMNKLIFKHMVSFLLSIQIGTRYR